MDTLQTRLDEMKAGFLEGAPEETRAVINQATEELRSSGILDRLPVIGSRLTPFELPDTTGRVIRSEDLLARGPLILSFYRGAW